ncbi:MAG: hypothetical protein ACAI35_06820 [Candidatus Methylacidiphilales bacterium]|nr:tetratricopeptide repeat protein [Candidatus Methylacidiphilales bacterium]
MGILIRHSLDRFIVWGIVVVFSGSLLLLGTAFCTGFVASRKGYIANGYYFDARKKMERHEFDAAIRDIEKAMITAEKPSSRYLYTRSRIHTLMGNLPAAIADIEAARAVRYHIVEYYYQRALLHLMEGKTAEAITELTSGMPLYELNESGDVYVDFRVTSGYSNTLTQDYVEAMYLRGVAHYMKGNTDAALTDLTRSTETRAKQLHGAANRMIWCVKALPGGIGAGSGRVTGSDLDLARANEELSATVRQNSWDATLCDVLTGKLSDEEKLLRAASEVPAPLSNADAATMPARVSQAWVNAKRCEAYFYSAARQFAVGNTAAGWVLLRKCVDSRTAMSVEYIVATAALARQNVSIRAQN